MKHRIVIAGTCLLTGLAGVPPCWAQPSLVDGEAIVLRCGGIGADESTRMRAEVSMYALTLLYATAGGAYLADVHTRIEEPLGGRSVEAPCGPVGQVSVPEAGTYRVIATHEGGRQEHWVELRPGGGATLSLRWAD